MIRMVSDDTDRRFFHSGDNHHHLDEILEILIIYGSYNRNSAIKRIQLQFDDDGGPVPSLPSDFQRHSTDACAVIQLNGDYVDRVDVWTDDDHVTNAIRFYMRSGQVSQIYGTPLDDRSPQTFQSPGHNWYLVGVDGSFGDVIYNLHFRFQDTDLFMDPIPAANFSVRRRPRQRP
eukprot:jgi/Psemu1/16661/gm1.16661_g